MYIITVYPLKVIFPAHRAVTLFYFASKELPIGQIVRISLVKRDVLAVVANSIPLSQMKTQLKSSDFQLKKIHPKDVLMFRIPKDIVSLAETFADEHLVQSGAVLKHIYPRAILTVRQTPKIHEIRTVTNKDKTHFIVGNIHERVIRYKKELQNRTLLVISPTIAQATTIASLCTEYQPILFHGGLKNKEQKEVFSQIQSKHHRLIIGTPIAFGIAHGYQEVLVIDGGISSHYRSQHNLDIRTLLENIWNHMEGALFIGSEVLLHRDAARIPSFMHEVISTPPRWMIIDTKTEYKKLGKYPIITESLKEALGGAQGIVYVNRKGLASITLCRDCGNAVCCDRCSAPLTLHKGKGSSYTTFVCHHCGKIYPTGIRCANCDSWNLYPYGFGTERVVQELRRIFPTRTILQMDKDHVHTTGARREITRQFISDSSSILVGTEMLIEEPDLVADIVAIANMDHLPTIPDFQIHESMIRTAVELGALGNQHIIQTMIKDHPLFQAFHEGTIDAFIANELIDRREAGFSPYTELITVIVQEKKEDDAAALAHNMRSMITGITSAPIETVTPLIRYIAGKHRRLIILRPTKEEWKNNHKLRHMLRLLDMKWSLAVNPPQTV